MAETNWTDDRVALLKEMWCKGASARDIAEVLGGVTRNSVIGKAHRLGLPERASPIVRKAAPPPRTLAPGRRACSWPIGDPRDPGFHFCGSEAAQGRPYCGEHAALAYVKGGKSQAA